MGEGPGKGQAGAARGLRAHKAQGRVDEWLATAVAKEAELGSM